MKQKIVALSYTKQRTMFGFVGIEADSQEKVAGVRLAKQWKRDEMNSIPNDISAIYNKVKWDLTYADQLVGQHMIRGVERSLGFNVAVITTQKNLKDPEKVELVKVMDMTEITQLALSLKQNHKIQFPSKNQTPDMQQLIKQMEMFTEHVSEQGAVAYFAPGEELDCLPRALLICLFVARMKLTDFDMPMIVMRGSHLDAKPKTAQESFQQTMDAIPSLSADTWGLGDAQLNRMNRRKLLFE